MNDTTLTVLITTLITVIVSTAVPTIISYLVKRKFDSYFKAKEEKELRHQREIEELNELRDKKIREDRRRDTEEIICQAIETLKKDLELLKKSNQQTLRANLLQMYDKYSKLGYCPLDEKGRFDLMFQVYHSLGKNGVMDECHRKLMALPDIKPVKKAKKQLNEEK